MSNVALNKVDISSLNIDNTLKEVYICHNNFAKIKEYKDKNQVSSEIDTLINFTFAYKGHSPNSEREYEFTTNAIKEDIFFHFNHFTLEDIKYAFKLGVRGEMGEYYGLNAKTFYDWLKTYKTKYINVAIQNVSSLLPKYEKPAPSKEEINKTNKKIVCDILHQYKSTGKYDFNDFGNFIYNFLDKLNILNFSVEEKQNFIRESRNQLKIDLTNRNEELNNLGKTYHKIDLKKAFDEIELESNKDYETQVIMLAKKQALKVFIIHCATENLDLETIINEKLN